jgi:hypothetical protein
LPNRRSLTLRYLAMRIYLYPPMDDVDTPF